MNATPINQQKIESLNDSMTALEGRIKTEVNTRIEAAMWQQLTNYFKATQILDNDVGSIYQNSWVGREFNAVQHNPIGATLNGDGSITLPIGRYILETTLSFNSVGSADVRVVENSSGSIICAQETFITGEQGNRDENSKVHYEAIFELTQSTTILVEQKAGISVNNYGQGRNRYNVMAAMASIKITKVIEL